MSLIAASTRRPGNSPSHRNRLKQQIDAIKSDKSVPEAQKKEDLAQLGTALKNAKPVQFKENVGPVLKYFRGAHA